MLLQYLGVKRDRKGREVLAVLSTISNKNNLLDQPAINRAVTPVSVENLA